jgi:hypothetical protein
MQDLIQFNRNTTSVPRRKECAMDLSIREVPHEVSGDTQSPSHLIDFFLSLVCELVADMAPGFGPGRRQVEAR